MRLSGLIIANLTLMMALGACRSSDQEVEWPGWRGPKRDGKAVDATPLRSVLPADGITPAWVTEPVAAGDDGGWGSPIVSGNRVYLYAHFRKSTGTKLGPQKYPWLPPDKRGHLTPEQYRQYEIDRRDEDEARAKVFTFSEAVYCFDATTGAKIFKTEFPSVYTRFVQSGTPAVADGRLFIVCAARIVRCLDAASGKQLWERKLEGAFRDEFISSSFAVADGVAAVLAGHLYAFDTRTGVTLWEGDEKTTEGSQSSPVVWKSGKDKYFIANVAGGKTACFLASNGKMIWEVDSGAGWSTPVIAGDKLITYSFNRARGLRCFKISLQGAEPLWTYKGVADEGSSPVVAGENIYVQGGTRMACVDLASGEERWATYLEMQGPRNTSPVAADGKILYTWAGVLAFAADPAGFKVLYDGRMDVAGRLATEEALRRIHNIPAVGANDAETRKAERLYRDKVDNHGPLICASPALVNGKLYIRTQKGLACYDLSEPPKSEKSTKSAAGHRMFPYVPPYRPAAATAKR